MTDDPVLKALQRSFAATPVSDRPLRAEPTFAAAGELPLQALRMEVTGVGALSPATGLTQAQAQALHATSTPAQHGQRERTVLDTRVRHTGEIAADRVALHWAAGALQALQADAAQALGLHGVQARLHNLLVYAPGQFFKPHQDTEKHPGMVATLVVVWPCAHIGGELQVRRGDSMLLFASQHLQAQALRWCAFYADCRHEVKPVQEGWRVVLSFDLVLPAVEALPPEPAHPALVQALQQVFVPDGPPRSRPWLLLLDHEYTEHGLRWPLLKGQDRPRVAALRAAALALGLVPQLALAEIHQSWTAAATYSGRGRGDSGNPEPDELIDEEMSLDFWVDAEDRPHKGQPLAVALADCVSFTDDHDDFLVNEEYEGYMGNYGETLDYWYRRAALVLQSPVAAEAARFATQPEAALADALKLARSADQHAALAQRLAQALPDVSRFARAQGRVVLARYAQLACVLPADLASSLCAPFAWQHLLPADAKPLAALGQAQGSGWLLAQLRAWAQAAPHGLHPSWQPALGATEDGESTGRTKVQTEVQAEVQVKVHDKREAVAPWPDPLPAFIDAAVAAQWPAEALDEVLAQALQWLQRTDAQAATPARRLDVWPQRLHAVCQLALALQRLPQPHSLVHQLQALLHHVAAQQPLYPATDLLPLLRALSSPAAVGAPARQALLGRVQAALQAALLPPLPAADDQGLRHISWTCRCAECKPALLWAESPAAEPLLLALAESRRQHVQRALQDAAAPLSFDTLRKGSPYKLVVTKKPGLHAQRQRQRAAWAADLAALQDLADMR